MTNRIPEVLEKDGELYERGRWVRLLDSKGELKAESSGTDLLQFYEYGDHIQILYTPQTKPDIWVPQTKAYLEAYKEKLEMWKKENENDFD